MKVVSHTHRTYTQVITFRIEQIKIYVIYTYTSMQQGNHSVVHFFLNLHLGGCKKQQQDNQGLIVESKLRENNW